MEHRLRFVYYQSLNAANYRKNWPEVILPPPRIELGPQPSEGCMISISPRGHVKYVLIP